MVVLSLGMRDVASRIFNLLKKDALTIHATKGF